ncbi:MAG: hypothetical protein K2M82_00455 [Lachnospiraceae bacterium]|nr:hypothetical protein [Lachnospiraceae bacterium]
MTEKKFVEVTAYYDSEGNISPLVIHWGDGSEYEIDKITDIRKAASLKSGGAGIRYTCRIKGQMRYLFLDDKRWFIEKIG